MAYNTFSSIKRRMTVTDHETACQAALILDKSLRNDDGFMGYEGTECDFDRLLAELFYIAKLGYNQLDELIETFWANQEDIMGGELDAFYFAR